MRKNILSKAIMLVVMVGIFLLPIAPSFNLKDNNLAINIQTNTALAVDYETQWTPEPTIELVGAPTANLIVLKAITNVQNVAQLATGKKITAATIDGVTTTTIDGVEYNNPIIKMTEPGAGYNKAFPEITISGGVCKTRGTAIAKEFNADFGITKIETNGWICSETPTTITIAPSGSFFDTLGDYSAIEGNGIDPSKGIFVDIKNVTNNKNSSLSLEQLGMKLDVVRTSNTLVFSIGSEYISPKTEYRVQLRVEEDNSPDTFLYPKTPISFTTPEADANTPASTQTGSGSSTATGTGEGYDLGCSIFSMDGIMGCIAGIFYLFWEISAQIAHLAGIFLDFFIYYSTNSSSYTSGFITKGWSAIRDISNMFFIIALLYVAIKTILGLGGSDNKKIIGYVIIIALLLNFSLFFTQVIIDGSNILAKIFYNNITSVDQNGVALPAGAAGQKSISVGLISKYNPQEILNLDAYRASRATFIFITLLLIAITLYTAFIFFSVAMFFVSRVVSLWISMIFSPIAFASYTLPFDIPGFGHKEWWSELLKTSFLAPIFIFMLYIIVMFSGFLNEIVKYDSTANWMQKIMGIIIPFIVLVMLLMKSKELASKYAGEMGKAIMKGAQMVGGVALGAGLGAAAILGRATVGRAGAAMAKSGLIKNLASSEKTFMGMKVQKYIGNKAMDVGQAAGKGSMDVRGVKIAGTDIAALTGMKVGKPKEGGFEKMREDQEKKKQKRADELKVGEDEDAKQHLNAVEDAHQELLTRHGSGAHEIGQLDKLIAVMATRANDASRDERLTANKDGNNVGGKINPATGRTFAQDALIASNNLKDVQGERLAIKNASMFRRSDGRIIDHRNATTNNNLSDGALGGVENTANAAQHEVDQLNNAIQTAAAQGATPEQIAAGALAATNLSTAENSNLIAQAAWTSAKATRDVTLIGNRDAAIAAAAANPADAHLAEVAERAIAEVNRVNADVTASRAAADTAQQALATRATNTNDAALLRANQAATAALNKIASGLSGRSINNLEDTDIADAHHHVEHQSKNRQRGFANTSEVEHALSFITSFGQYSRKGDIAANHKIRMGAKLDSGHGGKGGGH